MNLSLLESGIDSLNKGFQSLVNYENLYYNPNRINKPKKRFFHLKDSILFIQHGIEILLKYILYKHSPYLIFTNIDNNVKKAFIEKNTRNLSSVFESQLKYKIHTVNYTEAIERVKILPNITLGKALEDKLIQLELYRNLIMHSAPHLDEVEINNTLDELANQLDSFFYKSIGKSYKTISGYSGFVKNSQAFQIALTTGNKQLKANTNKVILEALRCSKMNIGAYEVKRFTDINSCTQFFNSIFSSDLRFAGDLYNCYCSGNIKIKRVSEELFHLTLDDKALTIEFSLKSIILFLPKLDSLTSPMIYIECTRPKENPPQFLKHITKDYYGIENIDYLLLQNGDSIFGEKEIEDFYNLNNRPKHFEHIRFYSPGLLAFLNVQGLKYNMGAKDFINKNIGLLGKEAEVILRNGIAYLEENAQ